MYRPIESVRTKLYGAHSEWTNNHTGMHLTTCNNSSILITISGNIVNAKSKFSCLPYKRNFAISIYTYAPITL